MAGPELDPVPEGLVERMVAIVRDLLTPQAES